MTLLEKLRAHKGGLVRLKTQLYWYGDRRMDGVTGRICLVLDATADATTLDAQYAAATLYFTAAAAAATEAATATSDALLLIDGAPCWIWVAAVDIELLT